MVECFCALTTRELNDMRAYASTSINTLVHFLLQMNTYVLQQGPALQSEAGLIILRNSWRGTMKRRVWQSETEQGSELSCTINTQGSSWVLERRHTNATKTGVAYGILRLHVGKYKVRNSVRMDLPLVKFRYLVFTRMPGELPYATGLCWVCVMSFER